MVQWLRFPTPSAGDPGSLPGQGTKSHMLQLRPSTAIKKKKKRIYIYAHRETLKKKIQAL